MSTYELNILKSSKKAQNAVDCIHKYINSKAREYNKRAAFKKCNITDAYWITHGIDKYINILRSEGFSYASINELIAAH